MPRRLRDLRDRPGSTPGGAGAILRSPRVRAASRPEGGHGGPGLLPSSPGWHEPDHARLFSGEAGHRQLLRLLVPRLPGRARRDGHGRPSSTGTGRRGRRRFQRELRSRGHEAVGRGRGHLSRGRRCPCHGGLRVPRQRSPRQLFRGRRGTGRGRGARPSDGIVACSAGSHASTVADDGATRSGGEKSGPAVLRGGIGRTPPPPRRWTGRRPSPRARPAFPPNSSSGCSGIALVVSLGGLLGEHLFSSAGLNPVPTTVPRAAATPTPATTPSAPTPAADRSLDAPLVAFMGLTSTAPATQLPRSP